MWFDWRECEKKCYYLKISFFSVSFHRQTVDINQFRLILSDDVLQSALGSDASHWSAELIRELIRELTHVILFIPSKLICWKKFTASLFFFASFRIESKQSTIEQIDQLINEIQSIPGCKILIEKGGRKNFWKFSI